MKITINPDHTVTLTVGGALMNDDYEPSLTDEEIGYWEHFGRYDEEPRPWRIDEASAEYQDSRAQQMKKILLSLLVAGATILSAQAEVQSPLGWPPYHGPYGQNFYGENLDQPYMGGLYSYYRYCITMGMWRTVEDTSGLHIVLYAGDGSHWWMDRHGIWHPWN
jgi:hypothetical protein